MYIYQVDDVVCNRLKARKFKQYVLKTLKYTYVQINPFNLT